MGKTPARSRAGRADTSVPAIVVISGLDRFLIQREARLLIDEWVPIEQRDFGLEIVEGEASRTGEAEAIIGRLVEALQTISFFIPLKVVWWKDTNLLGEGRVAQSATVRAGLDRLLAALDSAPEGRVRLIVTAAELSRQVRFTKSLLALPATRFVEVGMGDRGRGLGPSEVRQFIAERLAEAQCAAAPDAVAAMAEMLGTDLTRVAAEVDKLVTYVGGAAQIELDDVRAVCSSAAENQAWDLSDAFGERQLPRALRVLDRLLFQGETPLGLLYALSGRVRLLLVTRALVDRGVVRPTDDYRRFQASLNGIADEVRASLPADRARNPFMQHPYVTFRLAQQAQRHERGGLTKALGALLEANQELVTTAADPRLVLERVLVRILRPTDAAPRRPAGAR